MARFQADGTVSGGDGWTLRMARAFTRQFVHLLRVAQLSRLGRLRAVDKLLGWVGNHAVPYMTRLVYREGPQRVNGIVMAVPRPPAWGGGGEFHMVVGSYERRELKFVMRNVERGDCFIDVGAHIGYFTLPIAKQVGVQGRVIAMEPTPESARRLRENVAHNRFQWVDVIEAAASNESGQAHFTTSTASAMWNTLEVGTLSGDTSHRLVQTLTIDEVLSASGWPKVTWIKMDVEGHERAVLAGCGETLARYPDVRLMFEVSGGGAERIAASVLTLKEFEDQGFEFFELTSARKVRRIETNEISSRLHGARWQDSLFNLVAQRPT